MQTIGEIQFWHWWILGVVLLIAEILLPTTLLLWLGLSAIAVGLGVWLIPSMVLEWQLILFAVCSVLSIVGWKKYLKSKPISTDHPKLNRRGEQYVGQTFSLVEDITNGIGKIKVDDTVWRVQGPDLAAGEKVVVTGVSGVSLIVKSLEQG